MTWQRALIALSVVVILVVFAPRVTERVYEIRSAHAIEAAEKVAIAVEDIWERGAPLVEPGEELQFFSAGMGDFLALGADADAPKPGDYLDERDLFSVEELNLYGAGPEEYLLTMRFRNAYGRYTACEITPDGIRWVGGG